MSNGATTVHLTPEGIPSHTDTTLQEAYDASGVAQPKIEVTGVNGPVTLRDAAASIGDLFILEDNAGVDFFNVSETQMQFGTTPQRLLNINNIVGGYGGIEFYPDDFTRTLVGGPAFNWISTLTSSVPGGGGIGNETAPNFVNWAGEVIFTEQGNLFNSQSLFNQSTTVTCDGANVGPIYTMINQPLFRTSAAGGARTGAQQNAVRSQIRMGPNLGGTFQLSSHETFLATCIFDGSGGATGITTVNYFAPKQPTGLGATATIGTLNLIDFPNILSTGISTLRGINSAMGNGTFINHTGDAPIDFTNPAFNMDFADNAAIRLGTGNDVDISWNGLQLDILFAANSDALFIANVFNNQIAFAGSNAASEFAFTTARGIQFGAVTGVLGNSYFSFIQGAITPGVAGDFSGVLLTQAGNYTNDGNAMSTVSAWVINGLSYANSSGSVVDADTITINGMVTSAPGVTITNRQSLHVTNGRSRFDSAMQFEPINPAVLGSGDNDDWAGLLTSTANNGMRHWARITSNADGTSLITGIDSTAAQDGDTFKITNVGAFDASFGDQDAASAAANRIITGTGVTYIIGPDETAEVTYDLATARWRILYGSGA